MQIDVVDLCAILECIGLRINSVETSTDQPDPDTKGGNTVTIECKFSGLRVTMDSTSTVCTCPAPSDDRSNSCWKISSFSHGVHEENRETGSNLLGSLPEEAKTIMTRELFKIIQFSRAHFNEIVPNNPRPTLRCALFQDINVNGGARSLTELNITPPEEKQCDDGMNAPAMYRSLDTLTTDKKQQMNLPTPRKLSLVKAEVSNTSDILDELPDKSHFERKRSFVRQHTYTVPMHEKSNSLLRSKTSSPISKMSESMLQDLMHAEQTATQLRDKLANIVKDVMAEDKTPNDSIVSLNLDVSKISVCKVEYDTKNKYLSSPNLASMKRNENMSNLKKTESKSTTQLSRQQTPPVSNVPSRLKKLSPSFFKKRGEISKSSGQGLCRNMEHKSNEKLQSRIAAPVVRTRLSTGGSVNRTPTNSKINSPVTSLSTTKKKMYSHVKSTIPKPQTTPRPTQSAKKE